jgi:septum formation protein
MAKAGYRFETVVPEVEEIEDPNLPILEVTQENARLKAAAVATARPDRVIIAADTLVCLDGEALGKPADRESALRMIRRLNGRTHQVFTAVCLRLEIEDQRVEFFEATEVTFRSLTVAELRDYQRRIDPLDKAGAYAAQDYGETIIRKTSGSWTNVVGLPMERLGCLLREAFGVTPSIGDP